MNNLFPVYWAIFGMVTNKQTTNRVILVQACSWPVWEGSLLQFCWRCYSDGLFLSDLRPMLFGHTLPSLLMPLFGLNHCWQCFLMSLYFTTLGWFWWFSKVFSWFLVVFHGVSWFFISLPFTIVNDAIFFAKPSGPMFLQYVWGSLTIICDYFWWPPTIGPAMRCLRFIVVTHTQSHTYRGPDLPIFTTQGSQNTSDGLQRRFKLSRNFVFSSFDFCTPLLLGEWIDDKRNQNSSWAKGQKLQCTLIQYTIPQR